MLGRGIPRGLCRWPALPVLVLHLGVAGFGSALDARVELLEQFDDDLPSRGGERSSGTSEHRHQICPICALQIVDAPPGAARLVTRAPTVAVGSRGARSGKPRLSGLGSRAPPAA
jgi:hypothetical protein